MKKDLDAAFYLTPFRLSEFGIGAVLVWLDKYRPNKQDDVVFGVRPKFSEYPKTSVTNFGGRAGLEAELIQNFNFVMTRNGKAPCHQSNFFL